MARRRIAVLGSTGSIGVNTLKVVARYPDLFEVSALSAWDSIALLEKQIRQFKPRYVAAAKHQLPGLAKKFGKGITLFDAACELDQIAALKTIDTVVLAMRGAGALAPFLAAARTGKIIAPANKEPLVIAGDLIMAQARRYKATVIPIDSEQSAIFQCIGGQKAPVVKVHLTASGGPLKDVPQHRFKSMTVADILRHPRWKMGPKITVDSATLMNKGFEFIEAQRLFDLKYGQINIVVHPQAIIHSMVEFADGSLLAQLGVTDMRLPIQYALTYPKRLSTGLKPLDLNQVARLDFSKPDTVKFPALALALKAAKDAGTMPCVLNAADEIAVEAFLKGQLSFTRIYDVVAQTLAKHRRVNNPDLNAICQADQWAREFAQTLIKG